MCSATDVFPDYLYQEDGKGESLYLLFYLSQKEGCDVTWSQRNLIQQPGGKSMLLAEPSSFHDSETAARIVEALRDANFHGLGMVEFIRAHDRDIFIEMNPRIWGPAQFCLDQAQPLLQAFIGEALHDKRSEEHTSELQSLMRISYAVFCLQKKTKL